MRARHAVKSQSPSLAKPISTFQREVPKTKQEQRMKSFSGGMRQKKFMFKSLFIIFLTICIILSSRIKHLRHEKGKSFHLKLGGTNKRDKGPCALLFFGLMKSFEGVALPAIREKILKYNSHCDIFLHTYNLNTTPLNSRNGETIADHINVTKAFLLTDNVVFETEESFYEKRKLFLEDTRNNFDRVDSLKCCLSHDNMIKQWNSIAGAWDLMRQKEIELLGNDDGHYYKYVGLFRTDTYMVTTIPSISKSAAVAPAFASFGGQNDRMFYGSYENARIWADRFAFQKTFEEKYMKPYDPTTKTSKHNGYHSEYYLGNLMKHNGVKVTLKNICLWRIRNQGGLTATDCQLTRSHSDSLPNGYEHSFNHRTESGERIYYHWSKVWDKLAVPKEWNKWNKQLKTDSTEKGVIILSMHGSESSQLYRLLIRGYRYHDGGNKNAQFTIPSQNDAFLWGQGLDWKSNMDKYNHSLTMEMLKHNTLPTLAGIIGLDSLTEKVDWTEKGPWLVEDPRLSITLKSWLTFLNTPPAVIIVYRHPLEVARTLAEKEKDSIKKFLLLWIQYNKAAIQNSKNLCRVFIDTTKLHENIDYESGKIVNELSGRCGVKEPPLKTSKDVEESLFEIYNEGEPHGEVLETYNGCEIHDYQNIHNTKDTQEKIIYIQAMRVYCDLKSGITLRDDYLWPELNEDVVASELENSINKQQIGDNSRTNYILSCNKFTTEKSPYEIIPKKKKRKGEITEDECYMVTSHPIKDSLARFIFFQRDARVKLHHLVSHYTTVEPLDSIVIIDHKGTDELTAAMINNYGEKGMHVWRCDEDYEFKAEMWSYVIGKYAAKTKFLYPLDDDEYLTILRDGELHWNKESFRKELLSLPTEEKPYKTLRSVPIPIDCRGDGDVYRETSNYKKADLCRLQYTESDIGHYCYNKCFYRGEFFKGVTKGNHASNERNARACHLRYGTGATRNGTSPIPFNDNLYYLSNLTILHMQSLEFNEFVMHVMRGATATNFNALDDKCPESGGSFQYCWDFQAFKNVNFDTKKMREIYDRKRCSYDKDDPQSHIYSIKKVIDTICQDSVKP